MPTPPSTTHESQPDAEPSPACAHFRSVALDKGDPEEGVKDGQRLESLGTLAGGIAHDFNNLLAIILGYASLLKQVAPDNPRVIEYGETIMDAGRRGADVVRQLMLYANQHEPLLMRNDVHSVLGDVLVRCSGDWPDRIELTCDFLSERSILDIDAEQLSRAVEHLLKNAREAITGQGKVHLSTADREIIEDNEERTRWVEIRIGDTGHGMDEQTSKRIFEPFFVHKRSSHSRGLGLPMVYGIVRAHGGRIEVSSTPGKGTTITLLLPHSRETLQPDFRHEEPQIFELKPGAVILLVEDEDDLAKLWDNLLTNQGWTILWAKNGREALTLFEEHRNNIDLVFADVGLPGDLDGWDVCCRLRAQRPRLPVILASGYFKRSLQNLPRMTDSVVLIDKPYKPTEVLDHMRTLIGQN